MRQTSRAVALLLTLESASANPTSIAFGTGLQDYSSTIINQPLTTQNDAANTLNNRKAPWQANPTSYVTNLETATAVAQKQTTGSSATGVATVVAGSSCTQCIMGGGVWCSRTYSYLVATAGDYAYKNTASGSTVLIGNFLEAKVAASGTVITGTVDGGSCCGTNADFTGWIGKLGTNGVTPTQAASNNTGTPGFGSTCSAFTSTPDGGTAGKFTAAFYILGTAYRSWWCSNGLYLNSTGSAAGTYNIVQPYFQGANHRTELSLVACPQLVDKCGVTGSASAKITTIFNNLTSTTATAVPILVKTAAGPAVTDKCTWVAYATVAAPTFTIGKTTESTNYGLVTLNWQVHSVEYNGTDLPYTAGTAGYMGAGALAIGNEVPKPQMTQSYFNTLRTWYGIGATSATNASNWNAPYQNYQSQSSTSLDTIAGQYYGNVASFPSSTLNTDYGAAYDGRVVRYFPAKVAQASWAAGNALYGASGSFATANTAYTTAKTTWNAYVAILAKNAKADAFAAAFSPPKAPTVPPLPSRPWVPGAYGGLYFLTNLKKTQMEYQAGAGALTSAGQPTNQEFWLTKDAAWNGGWGTFTAQIIKFRDGWSKSFGTIGYSKDSNALNMSAVYNYYWTCSGATGSATTVCDKQYTQVASPVANPSVMNTTKLYVAVSIWSLGTQQSSSQAANLFNNFAGTETGTGTAQKNDFMLTFTGKAWSEELVQLTSFATPTQPAAASSLSGIAGAQALAASAAAALAAAAALY